MSHKPLRLGQPFATCFVPKGRRESVIYVVTLRCQPGIVKVGRTTKWKQRRQQYLTWNLSQDGIEFEHAFFLTDDYVDLAKLENDILRSLTYGVAFGKEWFYAEFEEVVRAVEEFISTADLTFV